MHELGPWRRHGTLYINRMLSESSAHFLLGEEPRSPPVHLIRAPLRQCLRLLGSKDQFIESGTRQEVRH